MKIFASFKRHIPFVVFIVLYFSLIAFKLITQPTPFFDWDESLYIQNGREMLEKGYFLMPLWQGEVWLDKPPLIPLLYGIVTKMFFFAPAEIVARLFSLTVACIALTFVYLIYLKVTGKQFIALLSAVITSFTPLFLQRTQTVNLDIFVLLSWAGYLLFYKNFFKGLCFLFIGIMSKSLLGFYPVGIVGIYLLYSHFITKQLNKKEFIGHLKKIIVQASVVMLWFVAMLLVFQEAFWKQHIIESHFKRVSSSIESHFGKRTYYLDILIEQIGTSIFAASVIGMVVFLFNYVKKKMKDDKALISMYLMPWFLFLNVTKTKIFWYLLPALPQFAFLAVYPITILYKRKTLYFGMGLLIAGLFLYRNVYQQRVLQTTYSDYSPHYFLSLYAKKHCNSIDVLMSPTTRETYNTLASMDLTITTTNWWGEHPSMVYYSEKPITFIYDKNEMQYRITNILDGRCIVTAKEDIDIVKQNDNIIFLNSFGDYYLFIYRQ